MIIKVFTSINTCVIFIWLCNMLFLHVCQQENLDCFEWKFVYAFMFNGPKNWLDWLIESDTPYRSFPGVSKNGLLSNSLHKETMEWKRHIQMKKKLISDKTKNNVYHGSSSGTKLWKLLGFDFCCTPIWESYHCTRYKLYHICNQKIHVGYVKSM